MKHAIEDAAAELAPRDRALLRLHLVERASIDDIAALYRVHRATVARWIQSAREIVESELTLSLSRVLG